MGYAQGSVAPGMHTTAGLKATCSAPYHSFSPCLEAALPLGRSGFAGSTLACLLLILGSITHAWGQVKHLAVDTAARAQPPAGQRCLHRLCRHVSITPHGRQLFSFKDNSSTDKDQSLKGPASFILQMCQFRDRFDYAYASVWEGNFTNCVFSTGECTRPLEGNDCVVVTCDGGKILCPPACESLAAGLCAQLQCRTGSTPCLL